MKCFILIQTRDNNWDVSFRSELEIKIGRGHRYNLVQIFDMSSSGTSFVKNCRVIYIIDGDINVLRRNFEGSWLDPKHKNEKCKKNKYIGRLIISIIGENNKELEKQSSLGILYTNNITETFKDISLSSTMDPSIHYSVLIKGGEEYDEKKLIGLVEMILKNKIIYPQNKEIHY